MPWFIPSRKERREQVRDDINAHLPGADARAPNGVLRVLGDVQAALTHDNDQHLKYIVKMLLPDTAEGIFIDRWADIYLQTPRKAATYASGDISITGLVGAQVPTGARLIADDIEFDVVTGTTLTGTSGTISIKAVLAGANANMEANRQLQFLIAHPGIEGIATILSGLAGGSDQESDEDLQHRVLDAIKNPPHGGDHNDYVQWALEVAGVTRAWNSPQEMGIGTTTVRVMFDDLRADQAGIPDESDLELVKAHLDLVRPVTVADLFVEGPIATPLDLNITSLSNDTPEIRTNIDIELASMLETRAEPGKVIYASWVYEAISTATGEDHHDLNISNIVPASAGHIIVPGTISYV